MKLQRLNPIIVPTSQSYNSVKAALLPQPDSGEASVDRTNVNAP